MGNIKIFIPVFDYNRNHYGMGMITIHIFWFEGIEIFALWVSIKINEITLLIVNIL